MTTGPIDVGAMIEAAKQPETGALVSFVGTVRDDGIECLELETFEDAASADLRAIADEAVAKFGLRSVDIVHRHGKLAVGETIVLIIAGAGHRKEAFSGCEYIIDRIKEFVPIWKKEYTKSGTRWVEGHD
ncbi:MAG: molybdenum cofactor biosynthesis protein MoaE [Methanomicrobiales archaeon]|nr:molybdenum cofactor biosynthesis protein MoaE [Methanomicrobiales archaeon]